MIRFLVGTLDSPDDAVAITRREVDGDLWIVILAKPDMNARVAASMAASLMALGGRNAFRAANGLAAATAHPGMDVWQNAPFTQDMILPEHRIRIPDTD